MKIDRWNGNTLRRYHHPSRAIIIVNCNRTCKVIPASCIMIAVDVTREMALELIREARHMEGRSNG